MLLYWVGDRYVRTQGEAKKLGFGEETEVPTDKDGLMEFLNQIKKFHHEDMANIRSRVSELENDPSGPLSRPVEAIVEETAVTQPAPAPHPSLGLTLDVEEAIQNATPIQLASYANNVCWRIMELAKK